MIYKILQFFEKQPHTAHRPPKNTFPAFRCDYLMIRSEAAKVQKTQKNTLIKIKKFCETTG